MKVGNYNFYLTGCLALRNERSYSVIIAFLLRIQNDIYVGLFCVLIPNMYPGLYKTIAVFLNMKIKSRHPLSFKILFN